MHFVCISASNIRHAKNNSTSLKACKLIVELLEEKLKKKVTADIIPLVDFEMEPCIGCGGCYEKDECIKDQVFNQLYSRIKLGDGLFIVSPHYAPIPAKLCILLEKIEQLTFLPRFKNDNYRSPLFGRPVGIIAHGGGTEDIAKWYHMIVADPIFNALSWPVEMDIISLEKGKKGVVFPVKEVIHDSESPFPIQKYDWQDIRKRLEPLVGAVVAKVCNRII
jgi:hypothetical protein